MKNKPEEWNIPITADGQPITCTEDWDAFLEYRSVVEKSAYDKLKAELEDYKEQLRWSLQKEEQLKQQLFSLTDKGLK